MRHRPLCLVFCTTFLLVWNHPLKAAAFIQQDTLRQDTLCVTPYFAKTPVSAIGNFAVVKKDPYAFQTHAGFSVLNTLRGHVPGLSIGPNAGSTGSGLRGTSSMLVIDGLPYYSTFYGSYNLNAFDYENIYALSSGNAVIQYGGQASDGAVFLQSKTGKGIFKPSVEFSSFPSFISYDGPSSSYTTEQLRFTNAIAYAQDYGAADLRVSYNGTYIPETDKGSQVEGGHHNIKINTGFDIADRLNARLIVDGTRYKTTVRDDDGTLPYRADGSANNLQGNLTLQYQASDWLTFTSQSALTGMDNESVYAYSGITDDQVQENRRALLNLFASARQPLSDDLSLHAYAGGQYERQKLFNRRITIPGSAATASEGKATSKNKSLLGGVGLQFRKYWFADLNYRLDELSAYREDGAQHAYAITSAFVFSEAFAWKNNWFSSGKLRGSYGKTVITTDKQGYAQMPSFEDIVINPDQSLLIGKRMIEAGTDLSFFNHRLDLSLSYFHNLDDKLLTYIPAPGQTNISYTLMSIGELSLKGWEAVLSATTISRDDLSLRTTLTWSTPEKYIEPGTTPSWIGVGDFNSWAPDWTSGLLNQLVIGNFFSTFLIDMRDGGLYYHYDMNAPVVAYDGSNIMLRDLSIGYLWPETLTVRPKLSLSARNIWDIYTKDEEAEAHPLAIPSQKSISVSVSVQF